MMRIITVILVIVFGTLSSSAQDKTSLLQHINEIKSQSDVYYWDQYTHTDADTAKVNSTKRLLLHVNLNRGDDALSVEEIMPLASYVLIDRGKAKQYFAYIRKDGIPNNGAAQIAVSSSRSPKTFVPDAFVSRIMETKYFMNVYKLLKSMQAQGQVLQFGKLRDVEDYSSLDLILFDIQSQEIVTMLSPTNASGMRINVVNGDEDSLDNYPTNMTAVIWYIKK